MTPKELISNREYKISGKNIVWTLSELLLFLEIEIDWQMYLDSGIKLPPVEFGRCIDWHFKMSDNDTKSTFVCSWDIRRVKDNLKNIDEVSKKMSDFAISDN